MAKASIQDGFDGQERRLGEQNGLDTRVVLAVNAASWVLHFLRGCAAPKRRC